jgi:hypothetical protein
VDRDREGSALFWAPADFGAASAAHGPTAQVVDRGLTVFEQVEFLKNTVIMTRSLQD